MHSLQKASFLAAIALTALRAQEPAYTSYAAVPASADLLTLFAFDDYSIPYQRNLYLTLHPFKEYGDEPVVRRGKPGAPDEWCADFYGSVIRENGKYRMWYLAANRAATEHLAAHPPSFQDWKVCYAESADGVHWVKPNLGLVQYHGNTNNNIVQFLSYQGSVGNPPGAGNVLVLREPNDQNPAHRFKMLILLYSDDISGKNTILPYFSADGFKWRQAVPGSINAKGEIPKQYKVLPPLNNFEMAGLYDFQGTYYVSGQQITPYTWLADGSVCGRVMVIFHSGDFMHWSDAKSQGFVRWGYQAAPLDRGEEVHEAAATWNRGNVLIGVYGQFHGSQKSPLHPIDLGLLLSNDGVHFREGINDFVFLSQDKKVPWKSGGLMQGQGFLNVGAETLVYFCGWDADVVDPYSHGEIGLAKLRRDGFGSMSVKLPGRPASFITCPIEAREKMGMWINADGLSKQSRLKVELLNEAEQPLPGYSGADAAVVEQSGVHVAVHWRQGERIMPSPKRFRCRIDFEGPENDRVSFYALYVGREAADSDRE